MTEAVFAAEPTRLLIAALIRASVGAAVVAMTMAAGIMAAMPGVAELSPVYLAAMVCAINGGATAFSHVNDSGFWLVSSLLEIDEKTTLKSWTMMETIIGFTGLICAIILIPWCIPTVVSALMWSYMFAETYGAINQFMRIIGLTQEPIHWITETSSAFTAIVISDVWKTTPYMSLLLLSGLKTVPDELYEAAAIDGATRIQSFFSITLPSIKSVLVVAVMFRTIASFRIYDLIKVLTNGGPGQATTSLTMYTMQQYFSFGNYGYGAALAVVTFVVSLIIAFFFYDGMKSKLEVQ